MRPKGTSVELEQRRRQAIALLEQEMRPAQVARIVKTSRASVTRWKQAYEARGGKGLDARAHPGKPPKLTRQQRRRLVVLLKQGARKHGYNTALWTLARVAQVIERHFGVHYHPGHVWRVLRAMQWTSQKPERRAREGDERAIAQWREQEWPRIKKSPANWPKPCAD